MPSLLLHLRETNQRLGLRLDAMQTRPGHATIATPEQLTALLSELSSAGAAMRAQALPLAGVDPELEHELRAYRRHVERLRDLLPSIHSQLLAERTRLEVQRKRVHSAAEWARASQQIL